MCIIIVEGIDGVGKTTLIQAVVESMSKKNLSEYKIFSGTPAEILKDAGFLPEHLDIEKRVPDDVTKEDMEGVTEHYAEIHNLFEDFLEQYYSGRENEYIFILDRYMLSNIAYARAFKTKVMYTERPSSKFDTLTVFIDSDTPIRSEDYSEESIKFLKVVYNEFITELNTFPEHEYIKRPPHMLKLANRED